MEVRVCGRVEELAVCHLVFLRQKETGLQREILNALQGKPVLTVVESDVFFGLGAHVRLLMRPDGSVGYWVNRGVADRCGVKIGARMLQHADKVVQLPPQPR